MGTKLWCPLWVAIFLVSACAQDTGDNVKTDDTADAATRRDAYAADVASGSADAQTSSDGAQDLLVLETGRQDLSSAPEADGHVAMPDSALGDAALDAAEPDTAPRSYVCRDDSDCCIVVDRCMAKAYLYSKAPGASPPPTFSSTSDPSKCLRCISPGVQVRCANGQCTGTSYMSNSDLAKDHCGTVNLDSGTLDGGASSVSDYERAYESSAPISWGC